MQDQAMIQTSNAALIGTARDWCAAGHGVALAFVIETWGSSPRPVGSIMVIRDDGAIEGSVSGGCVEAAVIAAGQDAITHGAGQQLAFGVADAMAWEVGLSCGGRIAVLVTPILDVTNKGATAQGVPLDNLHAMAVAADERHAFCLALDAHTGEAQGLTFGIAPQRSGLNETGSSFQFHQVPPHRLIIIGAVHIAQSLAVMAAQAGYGVVVIDPRSRFATPERFPGVELLVGWPDEMMADLELDHATAVVTLTHDPKIDDPALITALHQPAFYIASLGSRRTHAARCDRLQEAGCSAAQIARIAGPAGLNIHAKTPAEIAVSILAQMIAAHRQAGDVG